MASQGDSVGTAVLGAGPAGLTAAYVLGLRGALGAVYEADGVVGGIAKTVEYDGYRFDLGGHRFFTKLTPVQRLWEDVLGDELLLRPRLSRIYYQGRYFAYPLEARDVINRLGLLESALCSASYFRSQLNRNWKRMDSFEDWVTANFGRRLYDAFFRSYTEKVWGIPGSEIHAEWAVQRIKDFSFRKALLAALHLTLGKPTTLIEQFHYPRLGPGQMWEGVRRRVEERGIPVHLNHSAIAIHHEHDVIRGVTVENEGHVVDVAVDAVLSSIPLSELVLSLEPAPPDEILVAARKLRYRALCLVALVVDNQEPFPDNWIYLHDPGIRAGRVQNFGAWSPDMVKPGTTCLGVEYFCFEEDEIWKMSDKEAVALATEELARIGLVDPADVVDGVKVRVPKAYPIYDHEYREAVSVLRGFLAGFENLKTFGRNGLHRYNNQDHSMWTAILATLNLVDGTEYDVWAVNTEAEYHEEGAAVEALLDVELVH
ncbi:MAG: NAD(P)/FAD-dependent oxidoreductase [Actinomycetota bacterium]